MSTLQVCFGTRSVTLRVTASTRAGSLADEAARLLDLPRAATATLRLPTETSAPLQRSDTLPRGAARLDLVIAASSPEVSPVSVPKTASLAPTHSHSKLVFWLAPTGEIDAGVALASLVSQSVVEDCVPVSAAIAAKSLVGAPLRALIRSSARAFAALGIALASAHAADVPRPALVMPCVPAAIAAALLQAACADSEGGAAAAARAC